MSRAITCPSCGGSLEVKAAGYTVTVACRHCGSVLDVANPDVAIIKAYHESAKRLDLPLGSRGTLFWVEWEAIGWLRRKAQGITWQEYLLFNPYAGYRWLVESCGEWQFGQMLTRQPEALGQGLYGWAKRRFVSEEDATTITTIDVVGEFYWRVRSGDQVYAESYASDDGQTLSMEATRDQAGGDDVQWTHLVPVPQNWIDSFRRPQGPDLARPEPARPKSERFDFFSRLWGHAEGRRTDLWLMAALATITAIAALFLLAMFSSGDAGLRGQGQVVVDGPTARITVGPVKLTRPHQFVTVKLAATSFTNRWVDLDYLLVNRATQATIPASATIEYYAGRDSDGSWSEGRHEASTRFSGVPAGDYDLLVEAEAKRWNDPSASSYSSTTYTDNPWGIGGVQSAPAQEQEMIGLGFLVEPGGLPWGLWWLIVVWASLPVLILYAYRASRTAVYGEDA